MKNQISIYFSRWPISKSDSVTASTTLVLYYIIHDIWNFNDFLIRLNPRLPKMMVTLLRPRNKDLSGMLKGMFLYQKVTGDCNCEVLLYVHSGVELG